MAKYLKTLQLCDYFTFSWIQVIINRCIYFKVNSRKIFLLLLLIFPWPAIKVEKVLKPLGEGVLQQLPSDGMKENWLGFNIFPLIFILNGNGGILTLCFSPTYRIGYLGRKFSSPLILRAGFVALTRSQQQRSVSKKSFSQEMSIHGAA